MPQNWLATRYLKTNTSYNPYPETEKPAMKTNSRRILSTVSVVLLALIVVYLAGPRPEPPVLSTEFPTVPGSLESIQDSLSRAEKAAGNVKKDNEGRIFWQGDSLKRTEYVLLYLHGYSASRLEGEPVTTDFAARYGVNLYAPRLCAHGLDTPEPLLEMTADCLWESAKNALAVAEKLGEKVIVMSTSTGGTLALTLAATYPEKIHALINISPNILPANRGIGLINGPWGLQIARAVMGGKYMPVDPDASHPEAWSEGARLESAVELQSLVEATMTRRTFQRVTAPSLTLAYYKDRQHQDGTVRVSRIRKMVSELGTPPQENVYVELPEVGVHPMASGIVSKDIPAVEEAIFSFCEQVLGLRPLACSPQVETQSCEG